MAGRSYADAIAAAGFAPKVVFVFVCVFARALVRVCVCACVYVHMYMCIGTASLDLRTASL
jgi:uncharacterized membrane protein